MNRQAVASWSRNGAALAVAICYAITFYAGYVGDPKTGMSGNPALALKIEAMSIPFEICGAALAAVWLQTREPAVVRRNIITALLIALGTAIGVYVFIWLGSIGIETIGNQLAP